MPETSDPIANAIAEIERLRGQIPDAQIEIMLAPLRAQSAGLHANVTGSGAIAQGGGDALGERAAKLRDNYAPINTGTQIIEHYYVASSEPRLPKEDIAQQVTGYLRWLRERMASIELRGIERAGGAPVVLLPLETAYVPLGAKSMGRIGEAQGREMHIKLNQVLGLGNRLVIIGGPGSGKTTVLLHMAWALASSLLSDQPEPACSRLGLEIEPKALPLPILVPLASFARYRRDLPGDVPARDKTLAHFISHHLISKQADFDLPTDFFEQLTNTKAAGRDISLQEVETRLASLLHATAQYAPGNEEVAKQVQELKGLLTNLAQLQPIEEKSAEQKERRKIEERKILDNKIAKIVNRLAESVPKAIRDIVSTLDGIDKVPEKSLPATNYALEKLKPMLGGGVLLLLDGLDEVANEYERAEVRQSVEDLVAGREALRVVVTCRTITYRGGQTALGASFREVTVQPLDYAQHIAPMVQQAYACIYPDDAPLRTDRAEDLLRGIQKLEEERRARLGEHAEALVDSPLMVRLLLIVHFNNRALPDERAELFDKAINALLQVDYAREETDRRELSTDWKPYRDMAQQLAFHMHQQGRDQGREIDEPGLKKALRKEAEFKEHIDAFLTHARQRGSVLEERGGAYRFIHLAFQEFLVARHLREVTGAEGREAILVFLNKRLEDPWWREPILLLAGYMGANAAKSARDFLAALARLGDTPDVQFSAAELAGTAALEWPESGKAIRADCATHIAELLSDRNALTRSKPVVRAWAGDTLSRLGDPRFDRDRFFLPADDMLGFVHILADRDFRIGTRKADAKRVAEIIDYDAPDNELNDDASPTAEFYMARYPVTVAQFRAFAEDSQFEVGAPNALLRDPDGRPVRYVSWHEALAYCDWLHEMLATLPLLEGSPIASLVREHGWRIALPSELEWEKAARGGLRDAVFSWGDMPDPNRANYVDTGIGDPSAVGCFTANGFGLFDMLGNVWEWTRSLHQPYPYRADDGREDPNAAGNAFRVLRGGSFGYDRYYARCAYRGGPPPDLRYFTGFRVVLRSSPVLSL